MTTLTSIRDLEVGKYYLVKVNGWYKYKLSVVHIKGIDGVWVYGDIITWEYDNKWHKPETKLPKNWWKISYMEIERIGPIEYAELDEYTAKALEVLISVI